MEFDKLAMDWLRELRGRRSQRAFSRWMGYQTNIAYRWESGRCFPLARTVLGVMNARGVDVRGGLVRFYGQAPDWLAHVDPTSRDGVACLLDDLRGSISMIEFSRRTGFSRHRVARWLAGVSEPRLPEWLALIEGASFRVLDFTASFFDPKTMPSVADEWVRLDAVREAAYEQPESHLVLRVLELADYQAQGRHSNAFIARRLGLTTAVVRRCLELLETAGQIRREKEKWVAVGEPAIDTSRDAMKSKRLRAYWLSLARDRLMEGRDGVFSFNLFSVSKRDLEKLRVIHQRYYKEMQEIIARSRPNERVALFQTQLLRLDDGQE